MPTQIELFSTKECHRCVKLSEYLSARGVTYKKRVMDLDPEAETDAIMNDIFAAPALKAGDSILLSSDLFPADDNLNTEKLHSFLGL